MSIRYQDVYLFYVEGAEEEVAIIHYRSWSELRKRLTTLLQRLKGNTLAGIDDVYTNVRALRPIVYWYRQDPDFKLKVCRLARIPSQNDKVFYTLMGKVQALGLKVLDNIVVSVMSKDQLTVDLIKDYSVTYREAMPMSELMKFPFYDVDVEQW